MRSLLFLLISMISFASCAQNGGVPKVYSNIRMNGNGEVFLYHNKKNMKAQDKQPAFSYSKMSSQPVGYDTGVDFDFRDSTFNGKMYFGLIKIEGIQFPQPVYFKRYAKIKNGKARIDIHKNFKGKYDFIDWEESGKIRLGYRIINADGKMLYDGKINLSGKGPFKIDHTIVEGPFINLLSSEETTISFKTNMAVQAQILVDGKIFSDIEETKNHEIRVSGLVANTKYNYDISYGKWMESYHFTTAPAAGSREKFTFAYASDSREGLGGGERAMYGTNTYIMKKMVTLAMHRNASFFQFTGDMINGYRYNKDQEQLEYSNWKNAVNYFWQFAPIYVGMGNHEALLTDFDNRISVDKFPFASESAESLFADNFVLPLNGPESEDGASYDPDPDQIDFPSYKENVYYYTYGNIAMVVLNSNYWYSPNAKMIPVHSGNLHGYIMDKQLEWFAATMEKLELDDNIDHVFVTLHTPAFPNGGHSHDDMWYSGNNDYRPYIAGQPVDKGILERRDEYLDIVINKSPKCVVMLHGDEHNYSRLSLNASTPIYPDNWDKEKLKISREFVQITNGATGAPYYSQEVLPWSDYVDIFSTLNALMLIHVEGQLVEIEVLNPDTFEEIERVILRK